MILCPLVMIDLVFRVRVILDKLLDLDFLFFSFLCFMVRWLLSREYCFGPVRR